VDNFPDSGGQGPIAAVPDTCVHQLFEQQAERTPGTLALAFDNQQFSYCEINESANRLAHHLIDLGVGPEIIVAVCLERSPATVVSLLAVLKAGGTYLPLEPHWPPERIKEIILDSATSIILVDSEATASAFREKIQSILLPLLDLSKSPSSNPAPARCAPAQLAYILYTSGSTGKPKGTRVEHKTLNNLLHWSKHEERLSKPAKTLQYAANVFDVSLQEIFSALTTGGSLWLISDRARRDFRQLYSLLLDTQIERIFMPYVALEQLSIYASTQTSRVGLNLRDIISAGEALILTEPIRKLLTSLPDCRLHNHYGPTESHVVTAYCADDMLGAVNDEVSIGRPISNSIIYLLDSLGCPCPIGIPGELHIGGAGLARDYLKNPELTAEKFIPDPFSSGPIARLYRSGDLASWNADGSLAFHGRIDQQIKLRGFRIEPGEIEAALLSHPAVAQAVVELRKDDPNNPRLIAYWVPLEAIRSKPDSVAAGSNAGGPATAEQLRAFLADRLPDYMVPAGFVELETLPLTTNGKLDRKALPAASFSGDEQQRVAPTTDLERQLHGIWAEVLGHGEFGVSDNFFLVGGHSLAAARLVSRIEQSLGQRLPLASLFQSPTLAALASRLSDGVIHDHRSFRSLVIVQGQGESSPLFVIHGGGGDVFIHVHLARCLAPRRPVYGLQAVGIDGSEARHRTVEEMASHYASEILRLRPQGPLHLLGYSGGGWYAWAVAAEILRRGGCLGLIGLVDTQGTADLHRRLRLEQLLLNGTQLLFRQLNHWRDTSSLPQWNSLRRKLKAFRFHSWTLLRTPGGIAPQALDPNATPRPTQPLGGDYFLQIHIYYLPPRLPVRVDIFSTPAAENNQRKLWNFYASGNAYLHPALLDHNDYYNADFMPVFAERLEALINDLEAQGPQCQPRVERLLGH
jgi:amino acid adenylation domain-containing protein